jgi:uncharacterized membrane protein (DUF373 family)
VAPAQRRAGATSANPHGGIRHREKTEEGDLRMNDHARGNTILRVFETTVVSMVGLLLAVTVAIAVVVLYVLLFTGLRTGVSSVESVSGLQVALQNVFGGVLLVLLGLELIDTLKVYFAEHHIRTEVILIVAMIAVGRHIIQIDFHHTGGLELVGMGVVVISLAASYYLVKKSRTDTSVGEPSVGEP